MLGGDGNAYSLKALGRKTERDVALHQTTEEDKFDVMGKVVFTAVAAPEDARKDSRVMVESSAGGPRIDPSFDPGLKHIQDDEKLKIQATAYRNFLGHRVPNTFEKFCNDRLDNLLSLSLSLRV